MQQLICLGRLADQAIACANDVPIAARRHRIAGKPLEVTVALGEVNGPYGRIEILSEKAERVLAELLQLLIALQAQCETGLPRTDPCLVLAGLMVACHRERSRANQEDEDEGSSPRDPSRQPERILPLRFSVRQ